MEGGVCSDGEGEGEGDTVSAGGLAGRHTEELASSLASVFAGSIFLPRREQASRGKKTRFRI